MGHPRPVTLARLALVNFAIRGCCCCSSARARSAPRTMLLRASAPFFLGLSTFYVRRRSVRRDIRRKDVAISVCIIQRDAVSTCTFGLGLGCIGHLPVPVPVAVEVAANRGPVARTSLRPGLAWPG